MWHQSRRQVTSAPLEGQELSAAILFRSAKAPSRRHLGGLLKENLGPNVEKLNLGGDPRAGVRYTPITVYSSLDFLQPDLEQLLRVLKIVTEQTQYDFSRLVLASSEGDIQFLEVTETSKFRVELEEALGNGFLALGLLGWQMSEGTLQAHKLLFKWHTDPRLKELFDRLCEVGAESVNEQIQAMQKKD
jgi:hypothetical protein